MRDTLARAVQAILRLKASLGEREGRIGAMKREYAKLFAIVQALRKDPEFTAPTPEEAHAAVEQSMPYAACVAARGAHARACVCGDGWW